MKTKSLLFSFAAALAAFGASAQTDITPDRFVFANQEEGEFTINYFNAGANPADNLQLASNNCDNGFLLLAAGSANVGTSGVEAMTPMTQAIQSATTIVDLGGEIGKVLCLKGTKSMYENGAENLPSDVFIGWFNYSFYLPKSLTPTNSSVRVRMVFNAVHNDPMNGNTLWNMYGMKANGTKNTGDFTDFVAADFTTEEGEYDATKWEIFEFDIPVESSTFPLRMKMEIQNSDWVNAAILIKELTFTANPVGNPVQREFVYYNSGTSNVAETILDQAAYTVNGNNVTFLQAGDVYGLNGVKVATAKAGETVQLNAGFYLVRTEGKAAKLVIR